MLYKNRKIFNELEKHIGKIFSFMKPNHITIFSVVVSFVCFYFILQENFLFASITLFINGFLDIVDGSVARFTKTSSKKGSYLDTIADRYSEFIIIFGLVFITLPYVLVPSYVWIFLYLFGSLMTTYAKASSSEKLLIKISGGILERAERIILLLTGFVISIFSKNYLIYFIIVLAILSNITALQRILKVLN